MPPQPQQERPVYSGAPHLLTLDDARERLGVGDDAAPRTLQKELTAWRRERFPHLTTWGPGESEALPDPLPRTVFDGNGHQWGRLQNMGDAWERTYFDPERDDEAAGDRYSWGVLVDRYGPLTTAYLPRDTGKHLPGKSEG